MSKSRSLRNETSSGKFIFAVILFVRSFVLPRKIE